MGKASKFSKSIEEEGLLLRNETLVANGHHDRQYWKKRLQRCSIPPRNPSELFADLHAQVAANQLGVKELENLVSRTSNEEVKKYINQVAFSSAEEFLEKYKKEDDEIIGHFGLGFYSSFMVANNVELITKSAKDNSIAINWECTTRVIFGKP